MEFVLGNIYRIAYGNGFQENPTEELGIGKLEKFIYDDANRVIGLHFIDRYGTIIKGPTKTPYYDSYGLEYTEALNKNPIPQEILEDYHKYFSKKEPTIISEEDKIDKGILDFNKHLEQFSFISNFMNVFYPKIKRDYAELKEKYEKLQEEYVNLELERNRLDTKLDAIKEIINNEEL